MYKARLAKKEEIPLLYKWAKAKRNRHVNFRMALDMPSTRKIIVERCRKPIGVVLLDDNEIMIYLVPRCHGKGLGAIVLMEAHEWIERYYPNIRYVWADIGSDYSERFFESMGYEQGITGDWYRNIN